MASSSSLSSVVSNLVRAQLGTSISSEVADDDLDKHVADLILREAKQKEEKYLGKEGVRAYYPDEPENKPRPNKRFLSAIIKTVDEHNAVVIETQARAAASAKEVQEEEERKLRRARADEAAGDRLKRLMGGNLRANRPSDAPRRSRSPDPSRNRYSHHRGVDSDYESRKRDRSDDEDARRRSKGKGKQSEYDEDRDEPRGSSSRLHRSKRDRSRSRERSPLDSDRERRRRSRSRSPARRHKDDDRSSRRRSRSRDGDRDRRKRRRRDEDSRRSTSPSREDRSKRRTSRSRSKERRRRDASPVCSSGAATPQLTLATNSTSSSQQHPLAKSTVRLSRSPTPEPGPSAPIPSKMDKYFDPAYDPMLDVETPATHSVNELIPEGAFDHWNVMLELVKQRKDDKERKRREKELAKDEKKKKKKRKHKDDEEETEEDERARRIRLGLEQPTALDVKYIKRGAIREWDVGKEVT